jgi:DNA-binding NarL/FixJ family response regulator
MSKTSVALVDDHPIMIEAISSVLSRANNFDIVATGKNARDAIEICVRERPQILILDLNMPGDAFAAISTITSASAAPKVVAFTASTGVESAIRALDSGASGYVLKGSSAQELIEALTVVEAGETFIAQTFATRVIAALRDTSIRRKAAEAVKLSIREEQIVRLLLRGKTNKEIAGVIKISEKTVKHYMTILMQKLQVRNRLEVVIAAQRLEEANQSNGFH